MKQYFLSKNNYNVPKANLTTGDTKLLGLSGKDVDQVLKQYPNEFLEVDKSTIILRDSVYYNEILWTTERLLDSYLSDPAIPGLQDIETLFNIKPNFFTREVVYKLIADSNNKYAFCLLQSGNPGIKRR
jgi:hypothetical protein